MDPARREIASGALFIRDHIIEQVGTTAKLPKPPMKPWTYRDATPSCLDLSTLTITFFKPQPKPSPTPQWQQQS
jgi:hypothetical protein